VVDLAMIEPDWKEQGRGISPDAVAGFMGQLDVTSPGGQLIRVAFTDRDPRAAAAGVKAVVDAYQKLFDDTEAEAGAPTMSVLESRRDLLEGQLATIQESIRSIANEFGSSALEQMYQFKLAELNKLESQLLLAQLNLAAGEARDADLGTANTTTRPQAGLLTEMEVREYIKEKRDLQRKIRSLGQQFGPNHPQIISFETTIGEIDQELAIFEDAIRSGTTTRPSISMATLPDGTPLPSTSRLRATEERQCQRPH
jgi:uncharacterized protein involved in exopolysaccharide biosynthesis